MKNLYLILGFLLASLSVNAQISDPTRATLDNIFAPLDKSQVPTGRLAEFATPLVPLDVFNGVLTDSSRTTPDGFRYIYATLYSAQVSGTALPTLTDLNNRVAMAESQAGSGVIPLLVQRIDYASVRPDAFNTNLLRYQNGQVSDVTGRSQSPYQVRTVFAAAPTRAHAVLGKVAFSIPSMLYTQSGGNGVSGQYIDCGDGQGYRITSWGQALVANYGADGTKRIKVRFTYNDGSIYESHFDIEIISIDNSAAMSAGGAQPLGALDFRVEPIAGVRAGGTVYVTPSNGHSAITKPFIVAEGYDPSKTIPIFVDNYTVNNFLNAINLPTANFYFKSQLLNSGYDIVFIDYDDGTDDILLNAALFKEVINQINTRKASSEQNVVLGISMGGLVARYGLADMEKSVTGSTQTRLLILQDSPQRGANTPLGLQALVRQSYVNFGSFTLFDINKALSQLNKLIDRPASQQLLIYRATDASSGCAYNTFLDNTYRPKITFPSGQNPPYQIIAASNGSQCGTTLFAPYTELARGDGNIFLSPFPWIIRTSYYAQVIVNAIPANGQANRLSTLQIYSIIRLFGFINVRKDFVREDYNCPAGLLAVDGVAGGTQYLGRRLPAGLPTTAGIGFSFNPFFAANANYSLQREFCFVPTASALDLNDFNQNTLQSKNINGISSVSYSRTNGFITQDPFPDPRGGTYSNEFHTTFAARNSEWTFSRMENKSLPNSYCSNECNPIGNLQISGPITLCGSGTYTSPLQAQGYTYSWSASPASAFTVSSGSGPTFQTANIGNTSGTITLTVNTPCPVSFTKQVVIGAPQYPTSGEFDRSDICNGVAHIRIDNYDPGLTYTVRGYRATAIYDRDGTFRLKAGGNQTNVSYTITASNGCGSITSDQTSVDFTCDNGYSYATYPNPSNDVVTVEQKNSAAQNQSAQSSTARSASPAARTNSTQPTILADAANFLPFTVRLYDAYGKLWFEQPALAPALQLRTAGLPAGSYVAHILVAGVVVQRVQLGIQH